MKRKATVILRDAGNIYIRNRISRSAAELSYFLTLSVFPFLICLNAMLASLNITESSLISMGRGIIPSEALEVIGNYFEYISRNDSTLLLLAGLFVMATSSSAAFRSIMNIMADIQGKSRFSGIFGTLFSFVMSIVFLAVIYLSGLIIVTGGWFLTVLDEHFGIGGLLVIWWWVRFVILFLILYAIIYGIYVISAPKERPRKARTPGAFLAALLLVGVSVIFSWFINMSVNYTLVYGSLASLIILMVWLYLCGTILILGNVFNILFHKYRRKKHRGKNEKEHANQPVPGS